MRSVYVTLAASALAACLGGCITDRSAGATGVGNPAKGSVTVAMVATDSAPAAAQAAPKGSAAIRNPDGSLDIRDTRGTLFTVRSGYANVGRIKIALPGGLDCSDDKEYACDTGEVTLKGPWVSDLMTGTWTPDLGAVRLPVGSYGRLEVRLEAQEEGHIAGPELSRHSLVFSGTFSYKGRADRPFSFSLDFDEDARFEAPSGIALDTGRNSITIALDMAAWLSKTDVTSCLEDGSLPLDADGGFAFVKGRGCGIEQQLKDAVKASGSLRGGHDG